MGFTGNLGFIKSWRGSDDQDIKSFVHWVMELYPTAPLSKHSSTTTTKVTALRGRKAVLEREVERLRQYQKDSLISAQMKLGEDVENLKRLAALEMRSYRTKCREFHLALNSLQEKLKGTDWFLSQHLNACDDSLHHYKLLYNDFGDILEKSGCVSPNPDLTSLYQKYAFIKYKYMVACAEEKSLEAQYSALTSSAQENSNPHENHSFEKQLTENAVKDLLHHIRLGNEEQCRHEAKASFLTHQKNQSALLEKQLQLAKGFSEALKIESSKLQLIKSVLDAEKTGLASVLEVASCTEQPTMQPLFCERYMYKKFPPPATNDSTSAVIPEYLETQMERINDDINTLQTLFLECDSKLTGLRIGTDELDVHCGMFKNQTSQARLRFNHLKHELDDSNELALKRSAFVDFFLKVREREMETS